jgi:hypothetical protein
VGGGAAFEIADLKAFAAEVPRAPEKGAAAVKTGLPIGPGRRRTAGSASFERAAELGTAVGDVVLLAAISGVFGSGEILGFGLRDPGVRWRYS